MCYFTWKQELVLNILWVIVGKSLSEANSLTWWYVFKTSWGHPCKTSWRCLEDGLKMSWRHFCRLLEDVSKTSWRSLGKTSWRCHKDVFTNALKTFSKRMTKANIFVLMKTSWRRLLKTKSKDVFKTSSSRRMFAGYCQKLSVPYHSWKNGWLQPLRQKSHPIW